MKFINNLYTLVEIGINLNFSSERLRRLAFLMNKKDIDNLFLEFEELSKFIPYCQWYIINDKNILAMSAYIYDVYRDTGLLPDIKNYDLEPDINKLEHWQYINPYVIEIDPNTGFEFAKKIYDCDVWNLFLSGNARMNFYENKNVKLEQRIKYAIVEYMMKRPQFFNTDDFVENEILTKKYRKKEG